MARGRRLQAVPDLKPEPGEEKPQVVRPIHLSYGGYNEERRGRIKCGHPVQHAMVQVMVPWEHPGMCQECIIVHDENPPDDRSFTQPVML